MVACRMFLAIFIITPPLQFPVCLEPSDAGWVLKGCCLRKLFIPTSRYITKDKQIIAHAARAARVRGARSVSRNLIIAFSPATRVAASWSLLGSGVEPSE